MSREKKIALIENLWIFYLAFGVGALWSSVAHLLVALDIKVLNSETLDISPPVYTAIYGLLGLLLLLSAWSLKVKKVWARTLAFWIGLIYSFWQILNVFPALQSQKVFPFAGFILTTACLAGALFLLQSREAEEIYG